MYTYHYFEKFTNFDSSNLLCAVADVQNTPFEHNLETYHGAGYKDLAAPFAELAKALDVDVVIG